MKRLFTFALILLALPFITIGQNYNFQFEHSEFTATLNPNNGNAEVVMVFHQTNPAAESLLGAVTVFTNLRFREAGSALSFQEINVTPDVYSDSLVLDFVIYQSDYQVGIEYEGVSEVIAFTGQGVIDTWLSDTLEFMVQDPLITSDGLELEPSEDVFRGFPNPFTDQLTVEAGEAFAVYDVTGKTLLSRTMPQSRETLDVSTFPAGIYFLQRERDGLVRKLIKH